MKYLRLVQDCQFFTAGYDNDGLLLTWNLGLDLSPYKFLTLIDFQIGPMTIKHGDHMIYLYTNMIARTLYNPCREITAIRIPRNSRFVERLPTQGKTCLLKKMTHTYVIRSNVLEYSSC